MLFLVIKRHNFTKMHSRAIIKLLQILKCMKHLNQRGINVLVNVSY